jgi:hypothetical protein
MGNDVSNWKGTCVPLLEPFCVCPEKKRTCVTLPQILLFLPPKKTFFFCPREREARRRRPTSRVFVRVFHRFCCRRNSLKNRFAVGFGEISFYFLVFFLSVLCWNNFCGESDLQSDSETFRVSVCVLDRFRCWSNFCGEIDLQSDFGIAVSHGGYIVDERDA